MGWNDQGVGMIRGSDPLINFMSLCVSQQGAKLLRKETGPRWVYAIERIGGFQPLILSSSYTFAVELLSQQLFAVQTLVISSI